MKSGSSRTSGRAGLAVHGLIAILGWTAFVLLAHGPGFLPIVAAVIALALLAGCIASLLLVASWCEVLRRLLPDGRPADRRAEGIGGSP